MAFQTWVARFVVDNGRVTEEGARLRSFQRRRLDEPDVDLHLLAEPTGVKGDELGAQALDAIGRLFLQDRLSLTGGVLRALQATHQTLLDWNRRSLPREKVNAGVTGAVVSGSLVYLAQAGPSLVFLKHDGVLERLDPADEAYTPLGEGTLSPSVRRIELVPGDMLLAASTALETVLDRETLNSLLQRGSDEALPELYLMTRDLQGFGLFAITCHPADDGAAHDTADGPAEVAVGSAEQLTDKSAETHVSRVWADATYVETPAATLSGSGSAVALMSPPSNGASEETNEPVLLVPPPLDISRPIFRVRTEGAIGRSDYIRTTGPRQRFRFRLNEGKFLRVGGAVSLALLVVAFVPGLMREGRTEKLGSLVDTAQMQLQAAQAQPDPAEKRRLLEDSRRLAAEALRLDPANTGAGELRQQASTSLGAMDAVFDLGPMTTVTTLSRQVTGDVSIDALAVVAGNAYLLDSKGGRIISVSVAGAGPPVIIFQEGETYRGTPAKKPLYFTWEGPTNTGRLLVLDAERKLFDVRPGPSREGPEPVPLRRTNSWMSVGGIAAYDGNLYVLDPRGNQVHRYLPAAQGFDSEPTPLLAGQTGLTDAQGLAIDEDIFIYLKDGAMRRYRLGANAGFNLAGIDRLPKSASDLAVVGPASEVYLADTSNKRIIVAGKDGVFRRQFVSNAFTDIRAIAVDAANSQLYAIVGDALLTAPIVR